MASLKDIFWSVWVMICQFLGLQDYKFKYTADVTESQSVLTLSNTAPKPAILALPERFVGTCHDPEFKKAIPKWPGRDSPGFERFNSPSTRQVWGDNTKVLSICTNYEDTNNHIYYPLPEGYIEKNRTQKVRNPITVSDFTNAIDIIFTKYFLDLKYTVEISYKDISPDGYLKKKAMVINGTYPGPTLHAFWGQTIELTVINKLGLGAGELPNGTALHPHGLRLWDTPAEDGVPGVTQCGMYANME
ncbi:Laccase [Dactylellina cionopaga]|nr:Laccase [Dactylellina cionopaga]